jgi:ankyrin repeat protein
MVRLLLEYNANSNDKTPNGDYPLVEAIKRNNIEIVSALLQKKANPNTVDRRKQEAAIFLAIENQNIVIVKELIKAGADMNSRGSAFQETPLMKAISMNDIELVKLLMSNDAVTKLIDKLGWNAQKYAEKNGNKEILRLLEKS